MANKKMAQIGTHIHISGSLENWKKKLLNRGWGEEYIWWKHWNKPVVFFGLYRPKDFILFILHRGNKKVVWCGSDILGAGWWYWIIKKIKAIHICENQVERSILTLMLEREIKVQPLFFNNPNKYKPCFKPSKKPHVYLFAHSGYNGVIQAGLDILHRIAPKVPEVTFHVYGTESPSNSVLQPLATNIRYRGIVPEQQLDKEISQMQCGLRLHEFDGFSEVTGKSILMGQYPITRIPFIFIDFHFIDSFKTEGELIQLLKKLKNKKENNPRTAFWEYLLNSRLP